MALTPDEITNLRIGGQKLVAILDVLVEMSKVGVNLLDIERVAGEEATKAGGTPSFKGFEGYPCATCLCVNDGVVHCIPKDYTLKEGDILMIDMGLYYKGVHTDAAITVPIGEIDQDKARLLRGTYKALRDGVKQVAPDQPVVTISHAVETTLKNHNLTIFKEFVGHGVGRTLHEPPYIPNYVEKGVPSPKLAVDTAVAIEPIVGIGAPSVDFLEDDWTVVTSDGKPSAVYEETVLVTPDGYEIMTPLDSLVQKLKIS